MIMQWKSVYKACIESYTKHVGSSKSSEKLKTSFLKELVENTDFYKPILNKIMTTHE